MRKELIAAVCGAGIIAGVVYFTRPVLAQETLSYEKHIIFSDDFSSPTLDWRGFGHEGGTIRRNTDGVSFSKGACLEIATRNLVGSWYQAFRRFGIPSGPQRFGMDLRFAVPNPFDWFGGVNPIDYILFEYWINYGGTFSKTAHIMYNLTEGTLWYTAGMNEWVHLEDVKLYDKGFCWHRLVTLTDFDNMNMKLIRLNDHEFHNKPLTPETIINEPPFLMIAASLWTKSDEIARLYLDDVNFFEW